MNTHKHGGNGAVDLMIDIETLGTSPGCVVLQIGAVVFDPQTGAVIDEASIWPSRFEQEEERGGRIEAETLDWWRRHGGVPVGGEAVPVVQAVERLILLHYAYRVRRVWTWGNFDLPILERLFEWVEYRPPWHYGDAMDARTLWRCFFRRDQDAEERRTGGHDALADALAQVVNVVRCLDTLREICTACKKCARGTEGIGDDGAAQNSLRIRGGGDRSGDRGDGTGPRVAGG